MASAMQAQGWQDREVPGGSSQDHVHVSLWAYISWVVVFNASVQWDGATGRDSDGDILPLKSFQGEESVALICNYTK